ncbi:MAG: hypothetical protein WCT77_09240, partial [Bacteroidota bacterium]
MKTSLIKLLMINILMVIVPLNLHPQIVPNSTIESTNLTWVQKLDPQRMESFKDVQIKFNDYWKDIAKPKGNGFKQFKRWEWFWQPRLQESETPRPAIEIYKDFQNFKNKINKNSNSLQATNTWQFMGPYGKPSYIPEALPSGMGRINCIAFDPSNPVILWVGAAYGGVWKSTDQGGSWKTFPFTEFLSIGISDIVVAASNPNIVYAATGDADGSLSGSACYSIGVIKTTDGGTTWDTTSLTTKLNQGVIINRLLIHPTNPDIVFAATTGGVFSTTDGGKTWSQRLNLYVRDMEFKPNNPDILYVTCITQGTSGGNVWAMMKCDLVTGQCNSHYAFYTTDVVRMAVAVTPANPDIIYVLTAAADLGFHAVGVSTDAGDTWTVKAGRTAEVNFLSPNADASNAPSQGHYDLAIAVCPTNANDVYIGGVNVWRSTDGGRGWRLVAEWTGQKGAPYVHADQHSLDFFPASNVLYSTNDGGVNVTTNSGAGWTDLSSGLHVTQFYKITASRSLNGLFYGGTQDNGTYKLYNNNWQKVLGGDGMEAIIDYTNNNVVYGSYYYGEFMKTTDGGSSWNPMLNRTLTQEQGGWITPLVLDPTNPSNLYAGYVNIWKSTNKGLVWNKISDLTNPSVISSFAIAPTNPNFMYVAKQGQEGGIWKSKNGGLTWDRIITGGAVTDIIVHPKNPAKIFFTNSGYTVGEKVYAFDTVNGLARISGSLPNVPVNCIVYQTNNP